MGWVCVLLCRDVNEECIKFLRYLIAKERQLRLLKELGKRNEAAALNAYVDLKPSFDAIHTQADQLDGNEPADALLFPSPTATRPRTGLRTHLSIHPYARVAYSFLTLVDAQATNLRRCLRVCF